MTCNGIIWHIDLKNKIITRLFNKHILINKCCFDKQSQIFSSIGNDGSFRVWSVGISNFCQQITQHSLTNEIPTCLDIITQKTQLKSPMKPLNNNKQQNKEIISNQCIVKDGSIAIVGYNSGNVRVFNLYTTSIIANIEISHHSLQIIQCLSNSKYFICLDSKSNIYLVNLQTKYVATIQVCVNINLCAFFLYFVLLLVHWVPHCSSSPY